MFDVWAHLPEQLGEVEAIARKLGRDSLVGSKSGVVLSRGELLTITVTIDGLDVLDSVDTIVWEGVPTNAAFVVRVPADVGPRDFMGKAVVSCNGIRIAKLVFVLTVTVEPSGMVTVDGLPCVADSLRTAFASYASENRPEVLARIQGIKKVAPQLDVFVDVLSLRSGENWKTGLQRHVPHKDVFYLFWSEAAARSEWVEREWRLALESRGLDYIDPIPLEEPESVPPPSELNDLHFSDAYLAYMKDRLPQRNDTDDHEKQSNDSERQSRTKGSVDYENDV